MHDMYITTHNYIPRSLLYSYIEALILNNLYIISYSKLKSLTYSSEIYD